MRVRTSLILTRGVIVLMSCVRCVCLLLKDSVRMQGPNCVRIVLGLQHCQLHGRPFLRHELFFRQVHHTNLESALCLFPRLRSTAGRLREVPSTGP